MTAALELAHVSVAIGGRVVLADVSLAVQTGEVLGVVGANGSGKTTLVRAALGLARLSAGQALLTGRSVAELSEAARADLAAYLPQDRRLGWGLPAWRVAALGAHTQPPAEARRRALEALAEVGMADLAERSVRDMSGGEKARVLIARFLATRAPLLITDEAASGLDPDAQLLVMELLRRAAASGAAVVATLHDLTLAARSCDRIAVLASGKLVASGTPQEALTELVLGEAFGLDGQVIETSTGLAVLARRRTA